MRLSYDDLVRGYLERLQSTLRNFAIEPEFLGTWVHDEDDHRSLFEIFVAAQGAGCRDLTVTVGSSTAQKLQESKLLSDLKPLGDARVAKKSDGSLEISVALREKLDVGGFAIRAKTAGAAKAATATTISSPIRKPGDGLHPAYRALIGARKISFEGDASSAPENGQVVSVQDQDACLAAAIDAAGIVVSARHRGADGPLRAMLDGVCEVMERRPLLEARDHAVIRMEALFRDKKEPPPVAGVLTPRNADALFERPQRMVRALYAQYAARLGIKPAPNFWDDAPAAGWSALSRPDQLTRAKQAVSESCRRLGISAEGVDVLDVIGGVRLVLAYGPETARVSFGQAMMRLERAVKGTLDPRIELQLESLEDRNKRASRTDRGGKRI